MTPALLTTFALHAYVMAAIVYLAHLVRPWRWMAWIARTSMGVGLVLQGWGLIGTFSAQGDMPRGMAQGFAVVAFLLFFFTLGFDLRYRIPVLGAFLTPVALCVWLPATLLRHDGTFPVSPQVRQQLLSLHITVALLGIAAFGAATLVGGLYLLMEREVKGKRFGLLFSRLPSLQVLDDMNQRLSVGGFIALSFTLVTGAFFVSQEGAFWAWQPKEIGTVVAWCMFLGLLVARMVAGWRGRRVVWLTIAGFAVLTVCFVTSYSYSAHLPPPRAQSGGMP